MVEVFEFEGQKYEIGKNLWDTSDAYHIIFAANNAAGSGHLKMTLHCIHKED